MRVALFFDGNNYYRALRDFDQGLEIDLSRLATWVTRRVGGDPSHFVGAYYYTGTFEEAGGASESGQALATFLDSLEMVTGFFVRREPRVRRVAACRSCGAQNEFLTEKRVDTRLVAELIQLAAVDGFDVAFLLSGDGDFVPAVQAAGALGKQVYIGAWPGQRVARELRAQSFGVIDLEEGVSEFATGRRRGTEAANAPRLPDGPERAGATREPARATPELAEAILESLRDAQSQLAYVSRWYFTNKWRGKALPTDPAERDGILADLIAAGTIEEYQVVDANGRPTAAIRATAAAPAQASATESS